MSKTFYDLTSSFDSSLFEDIIEETHRHVDQMRVKRKLPPLKWDQPKIQEVTKMIDRLTAQSVDGLCALLQPVPLLLNEKGQS